MQDVPIVVINLATATDRRRRMADQLHGLGLNHSVYRARTADELPAFPGVSLRPQSMAYWSGKTLNSGMIGCFLSHYDLLAEMVRADMPHRLILEDDAVIDPDLPEVLTNLAHLRFDWDLIKLAEIRPVGGLAYGSLDARRSLLRLTQPTFGTQGYLVSLAGAAKLLKRLRRLDGEVDGVIDRMGNAGVRIFTVRPNPIGHDLSQASTIREQVAGAPKATGWDRWKRKALKMKRRLDRAANRPRLYIDRVIDRPGRKDTP
ncbi:MAG: glycosyltransferase family 25 protein [Pseudomonadota bacterium]